MRRVGLLIRMLSSVVLAVVLTSCQTARVHPVPESATWLTYSGGNGPGAGKHIVLISAEQEYRSEQSMPMLAKILSSHHGFDCTVLFGTNPEGLVDPTMKVYPRKGGTEKLPPHAILGLEHLATADALIFVTRLLTLPPDQLKDLVDYFDSGKPILGIRTANHGFREKLPYQLDGEKVDIGEILGGRFKKHHGRWHADSTRGDIVASQKNHPIVRGVSDIWGPSDVYRTYEEGGSLPKECTALVMGQPLMGRKHGDATNPKLIPLPVAWVKPWETSNGKTARVFHSTMGSGKDLESAGLRRLFVNAVYWSLGMEDDIPTESNVDIIGDYTPLVSGFAYEKLGVIPRAVSYYK